MSNRPSSLGGDDGAPRGGALRFLTAAQELGIEVDPVVYPDGTRTAADAADAIGCALSQIVKSLVIVSSSGPMLALTAGHHRLDLDAVARLVDSPVKMADADTARTATGYAIGGTPPFGHPSPIPAYFDESLLDHEIVYAAAGTPDRCFPIAAARLLEVTAATVARFTV